MQGLLDYVLLHIVSQMHTYFSNLTLKAVT